jgi:putative holliday junction resolvase
MRINNYMRLMGMDVGSRTVGISVSDLLGWTAQGVEIIPINEDEEKFGLDRVAELVDKYEVTGFVLGLPKNMNNTSGPRVDASKHYGEMLENKFHLPVDFEDERLTTVEAERMLIEKADTSRRKRKKVIDKIASELILQAYLDRKGKLTN